MRLRPSLRNVFVLTFSILPAARADVSLFPLFSDHAVLQKSDHVPVWGRATPGESVTVTLAGGADGSGPATFPAPIAKATGTGGPDGKWTVNLDLRGAGEGPFNLVAKGQVNEVRSTDVLVGEVWLCSGQSNMEFALRNAAGGPQEVAGSANANLRQFLVPRDAEDAPVDTMQGRWEVAGPASSGGFTAVGYYFAKQVQAVLHGPVGLIDSTWGGTPVETWTSAEGFAACPHPELRADAERVRRDYLAFQRFLTDYKAWQERFIRLDHAHPAVAEYTREATAGVDGWTAVTLPALFEAAGLPDAGATWLQGTIPLKEVPAGHDLNLFLGDVRGGVEVYLNGKKVAAGDFLNPAPTYHIHAEALQVGDNVLAVRLFQPDHGAGIAPGTAKLHVDLASGTIPLDGPWLAKAEFALPTLAAGQAAAPARPASATTKSNVASALYNGMIAPLEPFAMRGVLWYQGESNADRGAQYGQAFPLLITDWRARWGRGDFPFYWCQLANYQRRQTQPDEPGWADVREAQTGALRLPNTGEAVLIDVGEEADIHPKDKASVGARLARIALARDYGQTSIVSSGPVLAEMKVVDGGQVRLKFSHADGGLVAQPIAPTYQPSSLKPETKPTIRHSAAGQLEGFLVCGADHVWHWATAANIEGQDDVTVTCAEVPAPVAVRYAWASNPLCNLANGAGLPAGPFRTDDFPLNTAKAHY